jgi:transcriptional regulator with XRE-family HTH domain
MECNIIKIFIQYKYVSNKKFGYSNFYRMDLYDKKYIELLNIQIGCIIKLHRLQQDLSQQQIAVAIDSTSTTIGRIERAEVVGGWDKIYMTSHTLKIDYNQLFILLPQKKLINMIDEIHSLDQKLNKEKETYYINLKEKVRNKYNGLFK